RVDRLEQYPNETVLFSPGRGKYLTISESSWGVYSTEEGNVGFIPLPVSSGGTGATTPDGVRHILGLATNHIPVFLGVY
ncbi:hypothetical protein, partial [Dyella japonica]|uniref:hypothetical protein n=1 Tax=Dyella japonica TaxID=231455 RepID=UPI001B80D66A